MRPNVMATTVSNTNRKRGYQRLAAAMAWDPALAMVPRFRAANTLSLLILQAEIRDIEEQLEVQISRDDRSYGDEKLYSCNVDMLRDQGKNSNQWKLALELKSKVFEYNQMVQQQIFLNDHCSPCQYDYDLLHDWLKLPQGGASELRGAGATAYLKPEYGGCKVNDFIALSRMSVRSKGLRQIGNIMLAFVVRNFPGLKIKHRILLPEENTDHYRLYGTAEMVDGFSDKLVTILATVLILIPVIVLHFVTEPTLRLILIIVFTLAFTVSMTLIAEAKRAEVFAAAAAFMAVQVVYVGSVA